METEEEATLTYFGYSIKDRRLRKRMSLPRHRPYSRVFEAIERAAADPETYDVDDVLADRPVVQDFGDQVESLTIWYLGDDAWYAEYWDNSGVTRFFLEHRVEYLCFNAEWVSPLAQKVMTRILLLTQQERIAAAEARAVKLSSDVFAAEIKIESVTDQPPVGLTPPTKPLPA